MLQGNHTCLGAITQALAATQTVSKLSCLDGTGTCSTRQNQLEGTIAVCIVATIIVEDDNTVDREGDNPILQGTELDVIGLDGLNVIASCNVACGIRNCPFSKSVWILPAA